MFACQSILALPSGERLQILLLHMCISGELFQAAQFLIEINRKYAIRGIIVKNRKMAGPGPCIYIRKIKGRAIEMDQRRK